MDSMWTWASIMPGIIVRSPASNALTPRGSTVVDCGPTDTILLPSTTTIPSFRTGPFVPSMIRLDFTAHRFALVIGFGSLCSSRVAIIG